VLSRLPVKGALLALLLAALFFVLFTSVVIGPSGRARAAVIRSDLKNIIMVAEAIRTDTGRYPASIESMVASKNEDGTPAIAGLEKHPKDPWGHPYLYEVPAEGRPKVTCLGNDGQPGGEGEAADTVFPDREDGP
jgi:general secretion pathway protein G